MIIVISGPSGVGKSTIINKINKENNLYFCISSTTRTIRVNEIDGVDYNFISNNQFKSLIENDELIEHEEYDGNLYGTTYKEVSNKESYEGIILDLEVNGAISIMHKYPNSVGIFIDIDNEYLIERLNKRDHTDDIFITKRMDLANKQRKHKEFFKYNIFNNEINATVNQVNDIINKEIL